MLEKIKSIFKNKEKRIENLISFLIILVITLIVINKIIKDDKLKQNDFQNETTAELATNEENSSEKQISDLEQKLESILQKINGVGKVSVLLTYTESSKLVPIYNINSSTSITEEKDTSGGTRTTETQNNQKDAIKDSNSNIVTEKIIMPTVEGAIITAEGAENPEIKSNIISAVEAVTGAQSHKIQVFEMGDENFEKK